MLCFHLFFGRQLHRIIEISVDILIKITKAHKNIRKQIIYRDSLISLNK
jgi:hypothetical protein